MKVRCLMYQTKGDKKYLRIGGVYNVLETLGNVGYLIETESGVKWFLTFKASEIVEENTDSIKDSIVQRVINQFKERSEAGIKKYNTTLERNDLNTLQWLTHLQEELMDATLYIERLKQEYETRD